MYNTSLFLTKRSTGIRMQIVELIVLVRNKNVRTYMYTHRYVYSVHMQVHLHCLHCTGIGFWKIRNRNFFHGGKREKKRTKNNVSCRFEVRSYAKIYETCFKYVIKTEEHVPSFLKLLTRDIGRVRSYIVGKM